MWYPRSSNGGAVFGGVSINTPLRLSTSYRITEAVNAVIPRYFTIEAVLALSGRVDDLLEVGLSVWRNEPVPMATRRVILLLATVEALLWGLYSKRKMRRSVGELRRC